MGVFDDLTEKQIEECNKIIEETFLSIKNEQDLDAAYRVAPEFIHSSEGREFVRKPTEEVDATPRDKIIDHFSPLYLLQFVTWGNLLEHVRGKKLDGPQAALDHYEKIKILALNAGMIIETEEGLHIGSNPTVMGYYMKKATPGSDSPFDQVVLHKIGGPAIKWQRLGMYFIDGSLVPKRYGATPLEKWDANWLFDEPNVTFRRLLVEKMGWGTVLEKIGATLLSTYREYELYSLPKPIGGEYFNLLTMIDVATGKKDFAMMPEHIKDARAAISAYNRGVMPENFSIET